MHYYTTANGKTRQFTAPLTVNTFDLAVGIPVFAESAISALRHLDADVLVIKNFLSADEIKNLLQHLLQMAGNELPLKQSKTYPFSFAEINRTSPQFANELNDYFRQSKKFRNIFAQMFAIDMEKKITAILTSLNQNNHAKILDMTEDSSYIPFTVRIIVPEKNHINLHADNMFTDFAPEFYQPLKQVAEVKNQLSFFTVLQKPETGGELSIYNVAWDVAKEFNIEEQTIILETGKPLHVENPQELYRLQFDLDAGDLVVFPGGQLYHRIEEVHGSKMRITLGGFIGYSKTNNEIYYWS